MTKTFNDEEITLISNINYSARELSILLNVQPYEIYRERSRLGVKALRGAKTGKTNLKKARKETRTCIGKDCSNTFVVVPSRTKKYCSHSCQQKTANVAAKGVGSRKVRNPATPEYKRYARQVHGLSQKVYEENTYLINPNGYPRTLCGVENGWQLDHIVPIKECFEKGLTPQEAAQVSNLRMLPWKDNLMRQYNHV
jgi:hypothetical protein